jgi:hypothetical protein
MSSGRQPWRIDHPCPRSASATASAIPAVDRMLTWMTWVSRQGAKPAAAPARAAPAIPDPRTRTSAYPDVTASAVASSSARFSWASAPACPGGTRNASGR